ncbi:DUF4307 domain-containing protein [Streptomyces jumonjinensis]|uniref:DUF4307 domain-containing protein n=1 Tax=Streptomyces jumonjinensis TaxID=1945 RepID=A0A646KAG5_STRJU|nr:DUF4307 domain-containing protein [Streptomyces jumonjinensis]MQS99218.1 DUF4307 domain-containing protein [Streptomyces jumonjinensis]
MSAVREQLPEGRYGRSADQRADRRLKILGAVLGTGFLAMVGWFGYDYITEQKISAELIKFSVSSDREVQVHLEIRKDAGVTGSCTVRSRSEDGAEVGRLDVAVDRADETRIDQVVTVRTTARATSAELVQCAGE